jgi:circadian clock protein KaiC
MSSHEFVPRLPRFTSGIPGLDRVLDGGFFSGGVYIVEGSPGAGKTILANQICFHRAKEGQRVLYVTLLAESHARLLQHLQDMSFFDAAAIPEHLTYVSGFRALEEGNLRALLDLLRQELRAQSAGIIILDGFAAVGESAETDREFKKFVHELQVQAGLGGCTFFLLSSGTSGEGSVQPVHTMVDGLVRLTDRVFGVRAQRELQVQKFRGSRYLRGLHSFEISNDGIRVYPRLEASSVASGEKVGSSRLAIGIPRLDAMIGGGLRTTSTTMILGPSGVGKTVLGYRFLACSTAKEKGLLFSFYETPERVLAKTRGVGIDLVTGYDRGNVELVWQSPVEGTLDAIGWRILESVDRLGAKRLFVDGFNALESATAHPDRVPQFFAALGRELQARGVTTVYAAELRQIFSPEIAAPLRGLSPLIENMLLMRFVELRAKLHRTLSVIKLRDSEFDPAICEFCLTNHGLDVVNSLNGAEELMTGVAHDTPRSRSPKPAGRKVRTEAKKRRG